MSGITGVGAVFCAAHQPKSGGPLHGHTWEVTVWLSRCDAVEAQRALEVYLKGQFDHRVLPDHASEGEDIAELIGGGFRFAVGRESLSPIRVQIGRPLERIYAEWSR